MQYSSNNNSTEYSQSLVIIDNNILANLFI